MKPRHIALTLILVAAASTIVRSQGNESVVYDQPIHVRHFSGTIVDSRGMTVEYATVEVHNPKTHKLLASTFADGKGYFTFDDKKYGKKIELYIIQKGFKPTQYTALRRPFGDQHLRLTIAVAD